MVVTEGYGYVILVCLHAAPVVFVRLTLPFRYCHHYYEVESRQIADGAVDLHNHSSTYVVRR